MSPTKFLGSLALISVVALTLSGCTMVDSAVPGAVTGGAIQGVVHGGQQPVVGATVNLYAAGTAGYGASSTLISTTPAITDFHGNFTITGDYSCTTGQQVYLLATGGNAGAGTNSAISLLSILGNCPSPGGTSAFLSSLPVVEVNEVTTVAAAYVMAPYASDAFTVGTSGTPLAKTGVANAFANAANLVNIATGVAYSTTPPGNGTVPQSEINTLANILASCVNTSGPTHTFPGGNACDTLLNTATSNGIPSNMSGGAAASSDTGTAAIYIAQHPGSNISTLYGLQAGVGSPFTPNLSAAPNDFTVALNFTGGNLYAPGVLAIDASGNVWVTSTAQSTSVTWISEFSSNGTALSPASTGYTGGGLNSPQDIAIDASGNVWVTNGGQTGLGANSVSKFSSSGTAISGSSGYTDSSLNFPRYIAIDASGNVWVRNGQGNCLTAFNSSGTALASSSSYTNCGTLGGEAIDTSGNIWLGIGTNISKFQYSGSTFSSTSYSNGASNGFNPTTQSIGIDALGNIWATNYYTHTANQGDVLTELNSSGTAVGFYVGGGLWNAQYLAIDGNNNIWLPNFSSGLIAGLAGTSVSEFNSAGTAITGSNGYTGGGSLSSPRGIAIDGSGNVWVADWGSDGGPPGTITELVGAASPVVTPIVANLLYPYGSHAVSKP